MLSLVLFLFSLFYLWFLSCRINIIGKNWSEEVCTVTKVKNTVLWTFAISDLKSERIVGTFYKQIAKKKSKED